MKWKTPYYIYTSKQTFEKHADLILLSNSKNFCYIWVKDFDRFMTDKTKHHCQYCLTMPPLLKSIRMSQKMV